MSKALEEARQLAADGNPRKALKRLWVVEAGARTSLAEARGLLEVSKQIIGQLPGRQRAEAEQLASYASAAVDRLQVDPAANALIWVPRARFLAGTGLGLDPERNSRWDVIFGREQVVLRGAQQVAFPWPDLVTIGVEGAGQVRQGMTWRGFGFGLQGALEGALMASALTALTSTTAMDTVIVLQFTSAEAFFHYDELSPVALRRRLGPAFVRLRETRPSEQPTVLDAPAEPEHWVERLEKLTQLHRAGALDGQEFSMLKARLIAETHVTSEAGSDIETPSDATLKPGPPFRIAGYGLTCQSTSRTPMFECSHNAPYGGSGVPIISVSRGTDTVMVQSKKRPSTSRSFGYWTTIIRR